MLKYNDDSGRKLKTGRQLSNNKDSKILTLERGENIIRVDTGYGSTDGGLASLQVETSLGRQWGHDTGYDKYADKKGNFSLTGRRLAFLSTFKPRKKGPQNYQTVFHWI
jgi:hypothetical protein